MEQRSHPWHSRSISKRPPASSHFHKAARTCSRPPTPKSPLLALAESLSSFEAALAPVIQKRQKEQDEADDARGAAEFLQNNGTGFAEAVREGRIPANASPAFNKAYKEMEGRAIARRVEGDIFSRYDTSDIRINEDANAFGPWASSQVSDALNGVTDPDILKGAVPGISNAVTRLGLTHAKDVGDRVMHKAINGVGSDIIGYIGDASNPIVENGELKRWVGVTAQITRAVSNGRAIGIPEEKLAKVAVDSVVSKAKQERDVELLAQLPKEIAETVYGQQKIQEAHDQILIKQYNDERRAEATEARQAKKTAGDATRAAIETLTADVNGEVPDEVLEAGERGDPSFRLKVEDMRNKLRANASKVDPQREIEAAVRINTASDPLAQTIREIQAGNIAELGRVNSVLYSAQRLKQSRERGEASILRSPATRQFEKALREKFGKQDIVSGRRVYDEEGYGRALVDYHSALVEWEGSNESSSSIDRLKASRDIGETMLKSYGVTSDVPASSTTPADSTTRPIAPAAAQQRNPLPNGPAVPGITVTPPLADDPVERARQGNPSLRSIPDSVIKRYLPAAERGQAPPAAEREAEPGRRSALAAEGISLASAEDDLGALSARYESGGRGVGFVSTGYKDPGGPSYGVHQLSSKDSMPAFLRSPEGQQYAVSFTGLRAGTREFNEVYRSVATQDPTGLASAQKAFYTRTHYTPVYSLATRLGLATEDRGVQEALFSIGIQHGGAQRIVSAAAADGGDTPEEQIKALYAARTRYVQSISLPAETKAAVLRRYRHESKDAVRYSPST